MNNVLLTGGTGKLGSEIVKSGLIKNLLSPSRASLDITNEASIDFFLHEHDVKCIIHCAAQAKMKECEKDPAKAIETNIIGTCNLVRAVLKKEDQGKKIRFVHISSDGVYEGKRGNYSEKDPTLPYNRYGWSKLGAECAVNMLKDFCIIRTGFFNPGSIPFEESATDSYSSKLEIDKLVRAIVIMSNDDFVGTVNIGGDKKSDFDRYREFKPSIKPAKFAGIQENAGISLAQDASLNTELWHRIRKNW
jgi:dTDP-4-dehydrorhamnose reductase